MTILSAIQDRYSSRAYLPEQLTREELSLILEAARLAPSGVNARSSRIYVLQTPETLQKLNRAVLEATLRGNAEGISREQAAKLDREAYCFYYHAPTVLLITQDPQSYNAFSDTGCLLENAMIQAAALGLGSCWLNNVRRCQGDPEVAALLREFGVTEGEIVTGGLALGHPADSFRRSHKQDGNPVFFVD